MATKTISTTISAGYTLNMPTYTVLSVTNAGKVEGSGVLLKEGGGEVLNSGSVTGSDLNGYGVQFLDGGQLVNGSPASKSPLIYGYTGVEVAGAAGSVTNYGEIRATGLTTQAGVDLADGGAITNGATSDKNAIIAGVYGAVFGAAGALTNFGTVEGSTKDGVRFAQGGNVVNGAATDPVALIEGPTAILFLGKAGTVSNFGTVISSSTIAGAVTGQDGAMVTNGSGVDNTAQLVGGFGVNLAGAASTVTNFGLIEGQYGAGVQAAGGVVNNGNGPDTTAEIIGVGGVTETGAATVNNFSTIDGSTGTGVLLKAGGKFLNGSARAFVEGNDGVYLTLAGSVVNLGTIDGGSGYGASNLGYGVMLKAGGTVINGGGSYRSTLIEGQHGVEVKGGAGTVGNFGTILATGGIGSYAVALTDGGSFTNGSATNSSVRVEGYGGVLLDGAGTNLGLIFAEGDHGGAGVVVTGGTMTNGGSAPGASGQIGGYTGVLLSGSSVLVNYSSITGYGGTAVRLLSSAAELVVEEHSIISGAVDGDGGTLGLGSGSGAASFLGGDNVLVEGDTFTNFGTVKIDAGTYTAGLFTLPAGQSLVVDGTLGVPGTFFVAGSVTAAGTITGESGSASGKLALLSGGEVTFEPGSALIIAQVTQAAGSTMTVDANLLNGEMAWTQSGGVLSISIGNTMDIGGVSTFAGTLSGAGTLDLSQNSVISGTISVAHLGGGPGVSGVVTIPTVVTLTGDLGVATGGVTLTGAGTLVFDTAGEEISGNLATPPTITNEIRLEGDGVVQGVSLTNGVSGEILSVGPSVLDLNTGVINEGTIESLGAAGLTINAVNNTGLLAAATSPLTVVGAVTGAGTAEVSTTGTLIFDNAFNENVRFLSSVGGTLELDDPSADTTGVITGLSSTGENAIVLLNNSFVSGTTTYSYAGSTTTGVLTIEQGATTVATLNLAGGTNYTTTSFTLSAGPGGVGTKIIDPTTKPSTPPHLSLPLSPHPFIAAMAGFGADHKAAPVAMRPEVWRAPAPMLAMPSEQIA